MGRIYLKDSKKSVSRRKIAVMLSESQNWKCCYCGEVMWHPKVGGYGPIELRATFDHVIAQVHGGSDSLDNLVMACWGCNTKRGHQSAWEFAGYPDPAGNAKARSHKRRKARREARRQEAETSLLVRYYPDAKYSHKRIKRSEWAPGLAATVWPDKEATKTVKSV